MAHVRKTWWHSRPGSAQGSSSEFRVPGSGFLTDLELGTRIRFCGVVSIGLSGLQREEAAPECGQPSHHEPGRADLLVGPDALQRVPTGFMAPMRVQSWRSKRTTVKPRQTCSHLVKPSQTQSSQVKASQSSASQAKSSQTRYTAEETTSVSVDGLCWDSGGDRVGLLVGLRGVMM